MTTIGQRPAPAGTPRPTVSSAPTKAPETPKTDGATPNEQAVNNVSNAQTAAEQAVDLAGKAYAQGKAAKKTLEGTRKAPAQAKPKKASGGKHAVQHQKAVQRRKAYVKQRNIANNSGRAGALKRSQEFQKAKLGKVMGGAKKVVNGGFHALNVVSAGISAKDAYKSSSATTTTGKASEAAANGAVNLALSYTPVLGGIAAVENLVTDDPKKKAVSGVYNGTASIVGGLVDLKVTGNTKALEGFHDRSKKGDFGPVMKSASEAGDFWAEKGVVGGLKEFGSAIRSLF